ncbi:MAG: hypothetical protein AMXMBFR46_03640 [Acidimicrobiia bacterium]
MRAIGEEESGRGPADPPGAPDEQGGRVEEALHDVRTYRGSRFGTLAPGGRPIQGLCWRGASGVWEGRAPREVVKGDPCRSTT